MTIGVLDTGVDLAVPDRAADHQGRFAVDGSTPVRFGTGDSAKVSASITAEQAVADGRELVGEIRLVNTRGMTVGVGGVTIEKVTR